MKARCGTRSRAYRPARSRSSMQEVFQDVSGLTEATSQKSAACPGQGSSPRSGPSGERIGQGPRKQRGPSDLRIRIAPLMAHQLTRIPTSRPTRHCHEVSLPRASNPRHSSTGLPQKGLKPDFSKLRHAHTAQPGRRPRGRVCCNIDFQTPGVNSCLMEAVSKARQHGRRLQG